ncbi:MAG: helix-turn-helix domain-containing protein [Eubacteriales bacterium]|nr:helix-turn-helix domain-containing protein [Eubacteriales bacterium]
MDLKKIGFFLKELRKGTGITQEQAAEIFGVTPRTVSRWETGRNMPDLGILIQIAEYYDVEIKEILNGERKSENMDKEMKDTLLKVADYSELEKEKVAKAGNTAFLLMFAICAAAILLQLAMTADIRAVLGETAALLAGSLAYIGVTVHNGAWDAAAKWKSTPLSDAAVSVLCSALFSVIYGFTLIRMGASRETALHFSLLFFVGIAGIGFAILRFLAFLSRKKRSQNNR